VPPDVSTGTSRLKIGFERFGVTRFLSHPYDLICPPLLAVYVPSRTLVLSERTAFPLRSHINEVLILVLRSKDIRKSNLSVLFLSKVFSE